MSTHGSVKVSPVVICGHRSIWHVQPTLIYSAIDHLSCWLTDDMRAIDDLDQGLSDV